MPKYLEVKIKVNKDGSCSKKCKLLDYDYDWDCYDCIIFDNYSEYRTPKQHPKCIKQAKDINK